MAPEDGGRAAARTSLAVWDVPATVAAGERFAVKAGARSAAGCGLAGARIELRDAAGATLAAATLGDAPWPGTDALYWAELALTAPTAPGLATLAARLDPAGIAEPHADAAASFGVAIVARPEHTLTVTVAAAGVPIERPTSGSAPTAPPPTPQAAPKSGWPGAATSSRSGRRVMIRDSAVEIAAATVAVEATAQPEETRRALDGVAHQPGNADRFPGRSCASENAMTDTLPDRLSVDPGSPHYDADVLTRDVGIRFNGAEKTNVEEYCVSEGWIRVTAGKALDRHGKPLTIKLKGMVEPYFKDSKDG